MLLIKNTSWCFGSIQMIVSDRRIVDVANALQVVEAVEVRCVPQREADAEETYL